MNKLKPVWKALPAKELHMDLIAGFPEWLVWCAAGLAGAFALAALAGMLEAAFDLDAG